MEKRDLEWLLETLPIVMGSTKLAEDATSKALILSANSSAQDTMNRRDLFWAALGWEIADALQFRWAFGELTLEDATLLSHELAEHIIQRDCGEL